MSGNSHKLIRQFTYILAIAALALCFTGVLVARAENAVYYVDASGGSDSNSGTSWAEAFETLQMALTVAESSDQIWVSEGVYYPDEGPGQIDNDRTSPFKPRNGIEIYGGFAGNETSLDERDIPAHPTVLSGDIDGNDITDPRGVVTDTVNIQGSNVYHVVRGDIGVDGSAVLDGFIITAGQADGPGSDAHGGGIFNYQSSPTYRNLTIEGNMTSAGGGGMANEDNSNPMLSQISFLANTASDWGGGMWNVNSSPTLTDVTFSGNTASWGGGMHSSFSTSTLTNVTFEGNTAIQGGGMVNGEESHPTLTEVEFLNNTASSHGGGMFNSDHNSPTLSNVIFQGNSSGSGGGGMANGNNSNPSLSQVTFLANTASDWGGGMWNVNSSPTLTDVTFSGNTASWGGGIHSSYSTSTLTNVIFEGNTAIQGGGMVNGEASYPTLTGVEFLNNTASSHGGGMFNAEESSPALSNVIFQGNSSGSGGGGMANGNSNPSLVQVTFLANIASEWGGGMWNVNSSPTLTDVTFSGNDAYNGGGMHSSYSTSMLTNVIFEGNTARYGAGIVNGEESSPTLTGVEFLNNVADFQGGGMYNTYGNSLELTNITFSGNTAGFGGGIYNIGNLTINASTISGNAATSNTGGGIYNQMGGIVTVDSSTIGSNSAYSGAGIYNDGALTIQNGTVIGGAGQGNAANYDGGGIYNDANGATTIIYSVVSANSAGYGGGIFNGGTLYIQNVSAVRSNTAAYGGGIHNGGGYNNYDGTVIVDNSIIVANSADLGGGIWSQGTLTIQNGSLIGGADGGNSAERGGGIYNHSGTLTLSETNVCANQAQWGGGLYNSIEGIADLIYAFVCSNSATIDGGGLYNRGAMVIEAGSRVSDNHAVNGASAAGIFNYDGNLTIDASEISYNSSANSAGGIMMHGGSLVVQNGTAIANNTAVISGGGLYISARETTNLSISDSDFNANSAANGGGIYTERGVILSNSTLIGNQALDMGGGMYNESCNPVLSNVTFSGNSAVNGGGMRNNSSSPSLTHVVFSNNTASDSGGGGGGMSNDYSSPTLTDVIFEGNSGYYGGGLYNGWYNTPTLTQVIFNNNTGNLGGGMFNQWSSPILTEVTFSNNHAGERGGGMFNWWESSPILSNVTFSDNTAIDWGGGLYNQSYSSPALTNVTFSGNTAGVGGGLYSYYYSNPTLMNVTFSDNSATLGGGMYTIDASTPTLTNVVIGNSLSGGDCVLDAGGGITASYTLMEDTGTNACGLTDGVNGNLIGQDPLLGPLQDNGGATLTHALLPGSSAIDAGTQVGCPVTDQRGAVRPFGLACDMGAYELSEYSLTLDKSASDLTPEPGKVITLTLTVHNTGPGLTGGIISDTLPTELNFIGPIALDPAEAGIVGTEPPIVAYDLMIWANQGVTVTFPVSVSWGLAAGTEITNTATFSSPVLSESVSGSLVLVVANTAPVADDDEFEVAEDSTSELDVLVGDNDDNGDPLSISAAGTPDQGGTAIHDGLIITYTPGMDFVGVEVFTYTVTDGASGYDTAWVTVTVSNVADTPLFTSTPVTSAVQYAPYTYTVTTTDPDLPYGDVLTITSTTLPDWLVLVDQGGGIALLVGVPDEADVGEHGVVLLVRDRGGLQATQAFTIVVAERQLYWTFLPMAIRN